MDQLSTAAVTNESFQLDPRLAADSVLLGSQEGIELRLFNDQRYLWLLLIPQQPGLVEWLELQPLQQQALAQCLRTVSTLLKRLQPQGKLNIGTLGNVVQQFHLHVLMRHPGDPAWPGPVWGHSPREPYQPAALAQQVAQLQELLQLTA